MKIGGGGQIQAPLRVPHGPKWPYVLPSQSHYEWQKVSCELSQCGAKQGVLCSVY